MIEAIRAATSALAQFLELKMPTLSPDWWEKHVVDRLSFQQQRAVEERGYRTLRQLDFAALLRVLDQNWYEFSNTMRFPREGRSWVKELQTVRNKWAHLSSEAMPASEVYRDADTLGRFLEMISADAVSLDAVQSVKASALAAMTPDRNAHAAKAADETLHAAPGAKDVVPAAVLSGFNVGDLVALRSNPSLHMPILEVITGGPECRYRVFENNTKATYYESQLQAIAAQTDEREALSVKSLHAHLTSLQILSPSTANLFSLRSGRVQFVPYQYRPVLKLIRADRPRLLVADEVGVGKTIEAGLIIKELRARMDINSVLVICPKALVAERKWYAEMKRFDEHFTAFDGPLLRHCLKETDLEGEWPEQYAKAILPFSLFDSDLVLGQGGRAKDLGLLNLNPPPQFDLVIVDEAHHIRNSETFLHQGVRYFCDNAKAVVLLTATPVQLGSEDLFTLLNVLRPDLVIDHASFEQMAEPNRHINSAVQHCRMAKADWQQEARNCLAEVAQTEWGRMFLREAPAFQAAYDKLQDSGLGDADRVALTRSIEELYTFSPLINRTRRRDIGEFTTRKPETVTIDFTAEQSRLHNGLLDVIARILGRCHGQQNVKFMMTTIRRQAASCLYGLAPMLSEILAGKLDRLEAMEASDSDADIDLNFISQVREDIEDLINQARNLDPRDEKVEAFIKTLTEKNRLPNNKALVFSTFRHTLRYLAEHTQRAGLRYGLVHGDVPDDERADLRRRFALPKEDGQALDVLLSSEVGCEGLDFQFCDFLVNYDLPWNPMKIEQRIGRIDRYGQKSEAIAIINFITPGTVDADIYQRCLWRIGVFQHAVGGSEEILGTITQELHDIAESFTLTPEERTQRLQQLADNGIRQVREEQELESKQSELFGLNVPSQSWRDDIAAAETYWLSPAAIQRCVASYLVARLGGDGEYILGEKPLKTLRLSQEARNKLLDDYKRLPRSIDPVAREWEKWLKGAQPLLSVTFEQEAAAENPKAVHLAVVHPLVRQAAGYLDLSETKYCALTAQSNAVRAGTYHFGLYRWTKHGIKPDESLVAVADDPQLEAALFNLLQSASETGTAPLPDAAACDTLDGRHHAKWSEAQANHMAQNRELADHRVQSLTASHRARCKTIEDQIARATNEKIRLMKESELARANADFNRRIKELNLAAGSGDIRTAPVVFGTIAVTQEAAA
ncbi:helicase-related protein [Bradyrhizobium sp. OAE829]|uniref:DEAD/DEAH box helicase n=1 Tax=Bradyrhizobium sp. OAE829 TaxID=2663807 RepID=UPI00178956A0